MLRGCLYFLFMLLWAFYPIRVFAVNSGIGFKMDYSDNAFFNNEYISNTRKEIFGSIYTSYLGSDLQSKIAFRADYEENNTLDDQLSGVGELDLDYKIVPGFFYWHLSDELRDTIKDPTLAESDDNSNLTNAFSTGPVFHYSLTPVDYFILDTRVQRFDTEDDIGTEYQDKTSSLNYIHNFSKVLAAGLGYSYKDTDFDDFDQNSYREDIAIYGQYETNKLAIDVSAGRTNVIRTGDESDNQGISIIYYANNIVDSVSVSYRKGLSRSFDLIGFLSSFNSSSLGSDAGSDYYQIIINEDESVFLTPIYGSNNLYDTTTWNFFVTRGFARLSLRLNLYKIDQELKDEGLLLATSALTDSETKGGGFSANYKVGRQMALKLLFRADNRLATTLAGDESIFKDRRVKLETRYTSSSKLSFASGIEHRVDLTDEIESSAIFFSTSYWFY